MTRQSPELVWIASQCNSTPLEALKSDFPKNVRFNSLAEIQYRYPWLQQIRQVKVKAGKSKDDQIKSPQDVGDSGIVLECVLLVCKRVWECFPVSFWSHLPYIIDYQIVHLLGWGGRPPYLLQPWVLETTLQCVLSREVMRKHCRNMLE